MAYHSLLELFLILSPVRALQARFSNTKFPTEDVTSLIETVDKCSGSRKLRLILVGVQQSNDFLRQHPFETTLVVL